jgi:hypothetical protein
MKPLNAFEPATYRAAGAAPGRGRYEAATAHGPVSLVIETDRGEPPAHAADAALRLALAEPLLAVLDGWLGDLLADWQWCGGEVAAAPGAAQARWVGAGCHARLTLPWPLLRGLAPPPAEVTRLRWLPTPAEWVLATLAPAPGEAALLEPGGVVLLPASFEPGWPARLRAQGEAGAAGQCMHVDVAAGQAQPADPGPGAQERFERFERVAALPREDALAGERWELRMPLALPLPPAQLLGWLPAPLPFDVSQAAALWAVDGARARHLARGRLLPWGDGQALWIEALDAPAWT